MVQVLQDLENAVSRAPGGTASSYGAAGLDGAVSDLRPLLCSPNQAVRNVAYTLLLRYLKDNPAASGELLPDFLDCLENKNAAIVTTALERLPDFLLLCQGIPSIFFIFPTFSNFMLSNMYRKWRYAVE